VGEEIRQQPDSSQSASDDSGTVLQKGDTCIDELASTNTPQNSGIHKNNLRELPEATIPQSLIEQYPKCFQKFQTDLENDHAHDLLIYLEMDPVEKKDHKKVFTWLLKKLLHTLQGQGKLKPEVEYLGKYKQYYKVVKNCFAPLVYVNSKSIVNKYLTSGGMGDIYKGAYYLHEGARVAKPCAIKLARQDQLQGYQRSTHSMNTDFREFRNQLYDRFLREVDITTLVDHSGTVRAYDAGWTSNDEENGGMYLIMEYIDGLTFKEFHEKFQKRMEATLSIGAICELIGQVAESMNKFHQYIVHRDIKPQNLMIILNGGDGHHFTKVLDFGISRLIPDADVDLKNLTKATISGPGGGYQGTPDYSPAEQFMAASAVDNQADLYALGCTMFEMIDISNQPPFYKEGRTESISKCLEIKQKCHMGGLPELKPPFSCPGEVRRILKKMTANALSERYSSAGELLDDLKDYRDRDDLVNAITAYNSRTVYVNPDSKSSSWFKWF
tara:strand:- start:7771 stop:9264 length:1494 start_codon:yes stop_codon:yes gene_type:complete